MHMHTENSHTHTHTHTYTHTLTHTHTHRHIDTSISHIHRQYHRVLKLNFIESILTARRFQSQRCPVHERIIKMRRVVYGVGPPAIPGPENLAAVLQLGVREQKVLLCSRSVAQRSTPHRVRAQWVLGAVDQSCRPFHAKAAERCKCQNIDVLVRLNMPGVCFMQDLLLVMVMIILKLMMVHMDLIFGAAGLDTQTSQCRRFSVSRPDLLTAIAAVIPAQAAVVVDAQRLDCDCRIAGSRCVHNISRAVLIHKQIVIRTVAPVHGNVGIFHCERRRQTAAAGNHVQRGIVQQCRADVGQVAHPHYPLLCVLVEDQVRSEINGGAQCGRTVLNLIF